MHGTSAGRRKAAWSCCAFLLTSSLVVAQGRAPEPVRREVRANATCASSQSSAAVAVDSGGAAAVAWVSRQQQHGCDAVCVQRYDREGRRDGDETVAWAAPGSQQRAPSLAWVGRDLWAAWESFDRAAGARSFVARPGGDAAPVALGGRGAHAPTLACLGERLLAVWVEDRGRGSRVWLRRFGAGGEPAGDAEALSAAGETAELPVAAEFAGGGAVVVWMARGHGLRARRLTSTGAPDGASFTLPGAGGAGDVEPSVAALPGGGFAVAWMRAGGDGDYGVVAAAYDRTGEPIFERRRISDGGEDLTGATVVATPDGALCVAWSATERCEGDEGDDGDEVERGEESEAADVDVRARWLEATGVPRGASFVVTEHAEGPQRLLAASNRRAMSCGPDGELVVAWDGDADLGDKNGAHLTWLLRGAAVERLADAGPATPPVRALDEVEPLPTGVVCDSTLTEAAGEAEVDEDEPVFTGHVDQARGAENPIDGSGFEAITNTGWLPPDPHMAVGPDHVAAIVNGGIAFFKKDGTRTFFQDINGSTGFWGSLGAGGFVFDPRLLFDTHSGRWIAMAGEHVGSSRGYFDLAVSDDDDPNGTWFKYRFDLTSTIGTYFIDFPHIGVDERAVYISGNVFNSSTQHVLYVLDKQPLLVGQPVTPKTVINNSLTSAGLGTQIGPSAAGYMVQARTSTSFRIYAITNALTNPQLVSADVSVPRGGSPASAPQLGTSVRLSGVDRRVASIQYINGRIYAVHNVDNPVRARWYEFQVGDWPNSGPPPSLVQSGAVVTEGASTFLPSIVADNYGNILVGCAKSSSREYESVAYFYRLVTDPPGTMRGPFVAKASGNPYTSTSRWGDYSAAGLDPRDGAKFWFVHEWARARSAWSTWIEGQRFQRPTLTASAPTISAATGGSVDLNLDNPPYAGRGYFMLGGASGTAPGFRLPGPPGYVNMDLNIDGFTIGLLGSINTPTFQSFMGSLDASGLATATFQLPALPALAGQNLWFAYAQDGNPRWDFASETVQITIAP